jgi:hypothetical protein
MIKWIILKLFKKYVLRNTKAGGTSYCENCHKTIKLVFSLDNIISNIKCENCGCVNIYDFEYCSEIDDFIMEKRYLMTCTDLTRSDIKMIKELRK